MLNDLEKRDAFLKENPDHVLDGLYSAYDLELTNKKKSNRPFMVIFVILLTMTLIALAYSYYEKNGFKFKVAYEEPVLDKVESVVNEKGVEEDEEKVIAKSISSLSNESKSKNTSALNYKTLKLDEQLVFKSNSITSNKEKKVNYIDSIQFETDNSGINLVLKMPDEIDYLVYGLSNPERTVVEVENVELGFRLEDLVPVEPIVAIRYSINDEKRFKLVLESDIPMTIKKSITSQSENNHNLVVMMEYEWDKREALVEEDVELAAIVEQQVEFEKESVFKGDIIKTPVNANKESDAYAEKLFQEAYFEYKKGNISDSLKKLNMVLNQDAGHIKARSTLALVLSEKEHYELAYSVLNEGLIQYPENVEWIKMFARLLLNEGKLVEARAMLAKQQPVLALNTEYYALQAAVLQKLAEYEEAAKIYRNLLHVNPYKGIWWMGLGISLESLKRYDDALYAYQKASKNSSIAKDTRQFLNQRISRLNTILEDEST
jgi:tetratricopeptide (TPR) repeat protein